MKQQSIDVIALITDEQRELINKAITNGYPVEIYPSKNGFNVYKVEKKIITGYGRDRA